MMVPLRSETEELAPTRVKSLADGIVAGVMLGEILNVIVVNSPTGIWALPKRSPDQSRTTWAGVTVVSAEEIGEMVVTPEPAAVANVNRVESYVTTAAILPIRVFGGRVPLVAILTVAVVGLTTKLTETGVVTVAAVAVTVTAPATALVRVTVATPPTVAVGVPSVPVPDVTAKVTAVPSGTGPPAARVTLALRVREPLRNAAGAEDVTVMLWGAFGLTKLTVTGEVVETATDVALTVTALTTVLERLTVATPLASVVALAAESVPVPDAIVKLTGVPTGTAAPALVFTVAVIATRSVLMEAVVTWAVMVTAAGSFGLAFGALGSFVALLVLRGFIRNE